MVQHGVVLLYYTAAAASKMFPRQGKVSSFSCLLLLLSQGAFVFFCPTIQLIKLLYLVTLLLEIFKLCRLSRDMEISCQES